MHGDAHTCPSCDFKLESAHIDLQGWFSLVKMNFPRAHISWSWRGEQDQEQAYADHRTKLHFPNSPHNHLEDGKPCSLALDLFVLSEDHTALFPPTFYAAVNEMNKVNGRKIVWGGSFSSLGDFDHFQLEPTTLVIAGTVEIGVGQAV